MLSRLRPRLEQTLMISHARLLAGSVLLFIAIVIERCRHGIDFSDEGYYLNSIVDPWRYSYSTTQFGIVFHPLFRSVSFDIVALRQINVISMMAMAFVLAWLSIRRSEDASRLKWIDNASISLALASPCLLLLIYWLPTPNYNSLTLLGLLVAAIGFSAARHPSIAPVGGRFRRHAPAVLVGFGGALVFLAKPPAAVLLAAVGLPLALVIFERRIGSIAVAAATSTVTILGMSLALDGSPLLTVARYQKGVEAARFLAPSTSLFAMLRFESLNLAAEWQSLIKWCGVFIVMVVTPAAVGVRIATAIALALGAIACVIGVAIYATAPGLLPAMLPAAPVTAAVVLVVPSVAIATIAILGRDRRILDGDALRTVALAAFFVVCPYIFAFGTGSNTTHQASMALVFWPIAAALVAALFTRPDTAFVYQSIVALISVVTTVWLVSHSMQSPYRQNAPLHEQTIPVKIGPNLATHLLVDPVTARYIRELHAAAAGPSLNGAPVLDMTGGHPGAIFALGGRAIGAPWMIGGYPRSNEFAAFSLDMVPCRDLARAWLLMSPNGPRALSSGLLLRFGREDQPELAREVDGPILKAPQYLVGPASDVEGAKSRCQEARLKLDRL